MLLWQQDHCWSGSLHCFEEGGGGRGQGGPPHCLKSLPFAPPPIVSSQYLWPLYESRLYLRLPLLILLVPTTMFVCTIMEYLWQFARHSVLNSQPLSCHKCYDPEVKNNMINLPYLTNRSALCPFCFYAWSLFFPTHSLHPPFPFSPAPPPPPPPPPPPAIITR